MGDILENGIYLLFYDSVSVSTSLQFLNCIYFLQVEFLSQVLVSGWWMDYYNVLITVVYSVKQ